MNQSDLFSEEESAPMHAEAEWGMLQQKAQFCQRCVLHKERNSVVFGEGNIKQPDIAFIGEGPGETEDLKGRPFVGRAGQLLDQMIEAMEYSRDSVYITNIVLCRPPKNRRPTTEETAFCAPYLETQLRLVQPTCIVALGSSAAEALLGRRAPVPALRGEWHKWKQIPVRVTYHPAHLLRSPHAKNAAWSDLQSVMAMLQPAERKITSFSGNYRFLSSFWYVDVILDGEVYPSVEHAYQAAKSMNTETRRLICGAGTPGKAKRIGQEIQIREDWEEVKLRVMGDLVEQKFFKDPLRSQLLDTQTLVMEEGNNWGDVFWGVVDGKGQNHLGRLLMELRTKLRQG